jgi:hypothetical protein
MARRVVLGGLCRWLRVAGVLASHNFGVGYRQRMAVMDAVWPITALYFGPVAV